MTHLKEAIQTFIFTHFQFLPPEAIVALLSAFPILELRFGMPAGALLGLSFWSSYVFSVIGNLLPIPIVLLGLRPLNALFYRFSLYKRFYDWFEKRTLSKSDKIKQYGGLGLFLFTAIPLPTTGAYTACFAAVLFFIPFRVALVSISLGVLAASIIVGCLTYPLF